MRRYEGVPIRIATLPQLTEADVLEGIEFIECEIVGPAVLALLERVTVSYSTFDGDPESMLWEIPISRQRVIGAIGLRNCTFTRCTFRRIGFAGPAELIAEFRRGVTAAQESPAGAPSGPQVSL